jgi:tRNA/rRNA methyltransferase
MSHPVSKLRIVLVATTGALNLGAVARVMQNFGLTDLWLVNPQCNRDSLEARRMAMHGDQVLAHAQIVADLPTALADCQWVVGTAGRISQGDLAVVDPITSMAQMRDFQQSALVFGTEDRGLSNSELQYCQQVMRIPTDDSYPSLNLAQSVGICCYQWQILSELTQNMDFLTRQTAQDLLKSAPINPKQPNLTPANMADQIAPHQQRLGYYQSLEEVLLAIGYLQPHTAFAKMEKIRHIFERAHLTSSEVALLRGMVRQMNWARQNAPDPSSHLLPDSDL